MRRWIDAARARLALLIPGHAEARMDEELAFHVDMEAQRIAREQGVGDVEARRAALAHFGGVTQHKEALRDGRGLTWLGTLPLDFTLGLRMMAKTPGLTFVGLLGLSVAVAIGAFGFSVVSALTSPSLPFEEGDRIVGIMNVDPRRADEVPATHLHALEVWRTSLTSVNQLGAYRLREQNLITAGRGATTVRVAEMSATGFDVTRVAPVRGRHSTADDERSGAPPVAVIGYDVWQSTFNGREDIIGQPIRLGETQPTVIGVMPKGFAFPINEQVWVPLQLSAAAYAPGSAPPVRVFARLAAGASLDDAQRELDVVVKRLANVYPVAFTGLHSTITPYARGGIFGGANVATMLRFGQVAVTLLLCIVGINVAVLVYARTASRAGEIAVRTALGASRGRIVAQLFIEALVMSMLAAGLGLFIASRVFEPVQTLTQRSISNGTLPFWIGLRLTPGLALYVAAFAIAFAVIIGVVPGLKATRAQVHATMQDLASSASIGLGRTWTVLLVAQVAVSVLALPMTGAAISRAVELAVLNDGASATASVVIATPLVDRQPGDTTAAVDARRRYARQIDMLATRLSAEHGLEVVQMSGVPRDESYVTIGIDSVPAAPKDSTEGRVRRVSGARVDRVAASYFSSFDLRVVAGREFAAADYAPGAQAVIVNRSFTRMFVAGQNVLGRRLRELSRGAASFDESKAPTWNVVGVVEDFAAPTGREDPKVYLPLRSGEAYPVTLAVRGRTTSPAIAGQRIRDVALVIDPTLRLREIRRLDDILNDAVSGERLGVIGLASFALSVVLLSTAGIYALMSFTVVRRRREIGIRTALGARNARLLVGILGRSMRQVGIGVAIGTCLVVPIGRLLGLNEQPTEKMILEALLIGSMTAAVGILATVGPARRALRVPPNEALRAQ